MYLGTGKEIWLSSPLGDRFDEEILSRFPDASPPTYHIGVVGKQSKRFTIRVSRVGFPDGVTIITQKSSDAHDTWDARFDLKDLLYKHRHLYPAMRQRDPFYTISRDHWLFGAFSLLRVRVLPRDSDQGFDGAGYNLYFYLGSATHIPPSDDDLLRRFKNLSVYPTRDKKATENAEASESAVRAEAVRAPSSNTAPPVPGTARFDPLGAARKARETQRLNIGSRTIAPRRDPPSNSSSSTALQASRPRALVSVQGQASPPSSEVPERHMQLHARGPRTFDDAAMPVHRPKSVRGETPAATKVAPSVPQPHEIAAATSADDDNDVDDTPLDQLIDPRRWVYRGAHRRHAANKRAYHPDDPAIVPCSDSSSTATATVQAVRRSTRLQEKHRKDKVLFRLERRPPLGPEFWALWESIKDVPVTELLAREVAANITVFKNVRQEEDVKEAGRVEMETRRREKQQAAEEEEEYKMHPERFLSIEKIPLCIRQIVGDAIGPVRREDIVEEIDVDWEDIEASEPDPLPDSLRTKPRRRKKAITDYTSIRFLNKEWQRRWEAVLRSKMERELELEQIRKDAIARKKVWKTYYQAALKQKARNAKKASTKGNAR